ncbi:MAG TPA: zf-HC2 domain-containing protein [Planctomycetota bacterium]|nr:zf-HC2 domain-containing protein [Planctomycetota bacterium]
MADEQLLIQLSAYLDGELPAAERAAFEATLASDPDLRKQLDSFRKLTAEAAALPVPQPAEWQDLSGRTTDRDRSIETRLADAARTIPIPEVSVERLQRAWQNIARRTVQAEARDREAICVSAAFDGEAQAAVPSTQQRVWSRLDAAARTLPVPHIREVAWAECFHGIAERTIAPKPLTALEQQAAALSVPELKPEAAERAWKNIAARTVARGRETRRMDDTAEVPQVSSEKWQGVWSGIEKRIVKPTAGETPTPKVVQAQAEFAQHVEPRKRRHPWRWASGVAVAAGLLFAVFVSRIEKPSIEPVQVAALEVPETLDNRYMVSVRYVESQDEPVVCFFLKKDAEEDAEPAKEPGQGYWFSIMQ